MGKIVKDGFAFMEYVNSGLIRKIDDGIRWSPLNTQS